jgi:Tol biopolymer transport system component
MIRTAAAGALAALLAVAAPAGATSLPDRTFRVSSAADLGDLAGASGDTSLSASGLIVGFTSTAAGFTADDRNGATRDVFTFDVATGERRLVSKALGSAGANGPSSTPALSADGRRVAFASAASNLVAGDRNGAGDIFAGDHDGPVTRVSVAADGGDPDGPSSNPDISADGRFVVFESAATNLVAGDTNGASDVFLRDLRAGTTTLLSAGRRGAPANGASGAPAISAAGAAVSFASKASNLVPRDTNGVADVFVRASGHTERVSVDSRGRQQRAAVAEPFSQISDVSGNGRYVVFDSDAANLVRADANRHTDVFLRDRRRHTTVLVSASSLNVQGNNDSFSPLITSDGRIVAFQSFATNMARGDGPREDVFVRDLAQRTTSVVDVANDGAPRAAELVPQLLQRPALSSDGRVAAFSSTAENLVAGDGNRNEDVFLRLLDAPQGDLVGRPVPRRRPIVDLTADDPAATHFVCQVDRGPLFECVRGRTRMPRLGAGRHVLTVRAGGPGMLYDSHPLRIALRVDRKPPRVAIAGFGHGPLRAVHGTASDGAGVARVTVAVTYFAGKGCRTLIGPRFKSAACPLHVFQPASGTRRWSLRLPQAVRGPVVVYVRAIDAAGNASRVVLRKGVVQ